MADKRPYNFDIILYDDKEYWDETMTGLDVCQELPNCIIATSWAYVYHDKDVFTEQDLLDNPGREDYFRSKIGELKKPHYHFSFHTKDGHSLKSIQDMYSKMFDIPRNCISAWDDYRAMYRYLIHADNPDKFQYSRSAVVAGFDYSTVFDIKLSEEVFVQNVVTLINDGKIVNTEQYVNYALSVGAYSLARRNYAVMYAYMKGK